MTYKKFLLSTVYGIMLCGWGSIWIAEQMDPVAMLLLLAAILVGVVGDLKGYHLLKPQWNRLLLMAGLGVSIADWRLGSQSWFLAIVLLLLYVGGIRALAPKANRDLQQMVGLGFLQLLAASVLTLDLGYAFFFLIFFILAPWALFAVAVKAELEGELDMLQGEVAEDGELTVPFGADRLLTRGILVTMLLAIGMTMVVTVVFFMAFPRLSTGMISGRLGISQPLAGFSEQVRLGGMGSILSDSSPAARVVPSDKNIDPEQLYLRGIALDQFDGTSWMFTGKTESVRRHNGKLSFRNRPGRDHKSMRIILEDLGTNLLLLPQVPIRLNSPIPRYDLNEQMEIVRVPKFQGGFRYEVDYDPKMYWSNIDWETVQTIPKDQLPPDLKYLTQLPDHATLPSEIFKYAKEPDLRWVPAVLSDFSDFDYSLELPDSNAPLHDFFSRRAGHCEMFATSLALMFRAAGIPAVVVNGFRGAERIDEDYLLVRQRNAHSWVEIFLPGTGQVRFPLDPTPPLPPAIGWMKRAQETWQRGFDRVWFFWMDRVVSYDFQTQRDVVKASRKKVSGAGKTFRAWRDGIRSWLAGLSSIAVILGGGLLALGFGWMLHLLMKNQGSRAVQTRYRAAPRWLNKLVRAIERNNSKRPLHQPVEKWTKTLDLSEAYTDFFCRYDAWRYGNGASTASLRREARLLTKRLRSSSKLSDE